MEDSHNLRSEIELWRKLQLALVHHGLGGKQAGPNGGEFKIWTPAENEFFEGQKSADENFNDVGRTSWKFGQAIYSFDI